MDPRELFSFFKRRFVTLCAVGLVVFFVTWIYNSQTLQPSQAALVFVTVGMDFEDSQGRDIVLSDNMDEILDSFTETVQGWLFNPAFLDRLEDELNFFTALTVRKQEKQNLLVTLKLPPEISMGAENPVGLVETAAQTFLVLLNEEMQRYNAQTHSSFVVALSSITPMEITPPYLLNAGIAMFVALVLCVVYLLLWEYLHGRVTFFSHVERELGKKPFKFLASSRPVILAQIPWLCDRFFPQIKQKIVVALPDRIFSGMDVYHYPQDLKNMDPSLPTLLWVRLGKSSEFQLQELKSLLGDRFEVVVTY